MTKKSKARPVSRQVEFVRGLSRRFRHAGVDEAIATPATLVALAGDRPGDRDGLDAVHRVDGTVWRRALGGRDEYENGELGEFEEGELTDAEDLRVRALTRAVRRRGAALGEPAAPAGRKPAARRLLPLEAARDDRAFDATVEQLRDECVIDDVELARTQAYGERDDAEQIANELHVDAEELNYERIIIDGAQTAVPGGSAFPFTRSPKGKSPASWRS